MEVGRAQILNKMVSLVLLSQSHIDLSLVLVSCFPLNFFIFLIHSYLDGSEEQEYEQKRNMILNRNPGTFL